MAQHPVSNDFGRLVRFSGVPMSLMMNFTQYVENNDIPYQDFAYVRPKDRANRTLDSKKQQQFVNHKAAKLTTPKRIVVFSREDINLARFGALDVYNRILMTHVRERQQVGITSMPRWHSPTIDFEKDRIVEQVEMGRTPFPCVVLDALNMEMAPRKIEKVREIARVYPHPIYFVASIESPFEFLDFLIQQKPDMVLRVDENKKVRKPNPSGRKPVYRQPAGRRTQM